jgi:hypothetical protein
MQLKNNTPFDVRVQIVAPRGERLASVIIKSTYDLLPGGGGKLASEQVPLITQLLPTTYGTFHNEIFFRKQGVDLCVLGTLKREQPVTRASVSLFVGQRRFGLDVHGDRFWVRDHTGRLTPSQTIPFREMALGYDRALGGHRQFEDGSEVLFGDNPSGRGYYTREDQAENQLLPNIFLESAAPLLTWQDTTPVAGWGPYPSFWGLRATASVDVDPHTQQLSGLRPSLFNHAHPDLVFDALPSGQTIRVDGLTDSSVYVRVPEPPASVTARVADQTSAVPAPIDGVFVWCDDAKLVLTQRARFAYDVHSEEHREVQVELHVTEWR